MSTVGTAGDSKVYIQLPLGQHLPLGQPLPVAREICSLELRWRSDISGDGARQSIMIDC